MADLSANNEPDDLENDKK